VDRVAKNQLIYYQMVQNDLRLAVKLVRPDGSASCGLTNETIRKSSSARDESGAFLPGILVDGQELSSRSAKPRTWLSGSGALGQTLQTCLDVVTEGNLSCLLGKNSLIQYYGHGTLSPLF